MSEIKDFVNKYSRAIVLALILIPVLGLIVFNLRAFGNVLLVLLGFGAVVMIHEFGHFIAAKMGGIKVEAFSIFMPPIALPSAAKAPPAKRSTASALSRSAAL